MVPADDPYGTGRRDVLRLVLYGLASQFPEDGRGSDGPDRLLWARRRAETISMSTLMKVSDYAGLTGLYVGAAGLGPLILGGPVTLLLVSVGLYVLSFFAYVAAQVIGEPKR